MSSSPHHDEQKRQQWLTFVQQLSPDTDPRTIRLVGELHRVAHALYQLGENSLSEADLSYAQYRLLVNILFNEQFEADGGLNPSAISERQGISRNTVSALIRNLEKEGLVERHLDENDRRRFLIVLTPAGRARVRDHASRHFRMLHDCFDELSRDDQQTMSRLLGKLAESPCMKKRTSEGGK